MTWLSRLRELSGVAIDGRSVDEALTLVAETARELLGFDFCGLLVPNAQETALVIKGWSGLSREYVDGVNRSSPVTVGSTAPSSRAYSSGQSVTVADIQVERGFEPWGGVAQEQGYRSMISVPLVGPERVLGTLNGYHSRTHVYSAQEVERLSLLANHAAAALTSASLVDELRGVNASLLQQRDLLAKSEEIHRRLLRVSLESGGIDGVVRTLADLIGRPVALDDPTGRPLSAGPGLPPDVVGLEFPVTLGNEEVGRLRIADAEHGLDPIDARAVDHARVVIALEVLRIRAALEAEHRIQGEVLTDVLLFGMTERSLRRAAALGYDLDALRVATVARVSGLDSAVDTSAAQTRRTVAALSAAAAIALPSAGSGGVLIRPLVAAVQGLIVAVWPVSARESAGAAMLHSLRSAFPTEHVLVATSGTRDRPLPEAFRVAKGALALAGSAGRSDECVTPAGLGIVGVLLQSDQPTVLREFALDTLGPVMDYDEARGSDLLGTLRTYIDHAQDRIATAGELRVHPNTVNQRIRRIESLTGADLHLSADVVSFASAFAVWDVVQTL
ncbi:helix-turn-helix domain-containing protein [Herbiconiux ginsengi]|uniref:PucR C-terminal helix-turn-helix domain-containing protein n=1 Tax=Herbiconiux ginsengi TaxID=381665 RepID=A0A1H3LG21_9MICO|nr:GAF domain-containing protein [Herbiconiux ginsengi]SDY63331.1 PucR C-terminal helix-turn-helix domain-containing protein [Herbiconiux ginsengi]